MSQYGEPWEIDGDSIFTSTGDELLNRVARAGFPDDYEMRRIVLCVNNCAGLSDENLQTLLDNGQTLASVIFQMQKAHPIFAQVHSQQGQVVYDGNDAHPFQDVLFALVASATAKWNGDHTTAHACLQEARRAKDGLGHEQLAVLKATWREVME